jgi:hypothetical protein
MADEKTYCYKHKNEETALQCGRCERYICHKCAIIGPAGPRCPECGKGETYFRPGAVGYNLKRTFLAPLQGRSIWSIIFMIIVASWILNFACSFLAPDPTPEYRPDERPPAESQFEETDL